MCMGAEQRWLVDCDPLLQRGCLLCCCSAAAGARAWVANSDGSWTVTLSSKVRPADFKGNYLRIAADAPFYSVLRVYNPSNEVVQDKYAPPPFVRKDSAAAAAVSVESGARG